MRWEELFSETEAQVDAAERADLAAEVAERTRMEHGQIALVDRLRALVGHEVRLDVLGAGPVSGSVGLVGPDWLLLETGPGWSAAVARAAILETRGLARAAALPEGAVVGVFRIGAFLRGVARERRDVQLVRVDGVTVTGTVDRVGADHVDVAMHPIGESRRRTEVRDVRTVSLDGVAVVRVSNPAAPPLRFGAAP